MSSRRKNIARKMRKKKQPPSGFKLGWFTASYPIHVSCLLEEKSYPIHVSCLLEEKYRKKNAKKKKQPPSGFKLGWFTASYPIISFTPRAIYICVSEDVCVPTSVGESVVMIKLKHQDLIS